MGPGDRPVRLQALWRARAVADHLYAVARREVFDARPPGDTSPFTERQAALLSALHRAEARVWQLREQAWTQRHEDRDG